MQSKSEFSADCDPAPRKTYPSKCHALIAQKLVLLDLVGVLFVQEHLCVIFTTIKKHFQLREN